MFDSPEAALFIEEGGPLDVFDLDVVQVVILCGGRGMRAHPLTVDVPKPLLRVAGQPILDHLVEMFASQGVRRFVLAGGYKVDVLHAHAERYDRRWSVEVVDTGVDTDKGKRVAACAPYLDGRFLVTYGDGLADIDLSALQSTHARSGRLATVTVVPLRSQYGVVKAFGDLVIGFDEKPVLDDLLINAGFMVFEREALDGWCGDLETVVLPDLARRAQLGLYRHGGFWQSLDTEKDLRELEASAADGDLPWRLGRPFTHRERCPPASAPTGAPRAHARPRT